MNRSTIFLTICLVLSLAMLLTIGVRMCEGVAVMDRGPQVRTVPIPESSDERSSAERMGRDGGSAAVKDGESGQMASIPEEKKSEKAPIPEVTRTWDCGEESKPRAVKATLKDGTLRVFGKGAMRDYEDVYWAPWRGRFGEFGSFIDPASLLITLEALYIADMKKSKKEHICLQK